MVWAIHTGTLFLANILTLRNLWWLSSLYKAPYDKVLLLCLVVPGVQHEEEDGNRRYKIEVAPEVAPEGLQCSISGSPTSPHCRQAY